MSTTKQTTSSPIEQVRSAYAAAYKVDKSCVVVKTNPEGNVVLSINLHRNKERPNISTAVTPQAEPSGSIHGDWLTGGW